MSEIHDMICTNCGGRCSETVVTDTAGQTHTVPTFLRLQWGYVSHGQEVNLIDLPVSTPARTALLTPLAAVVLCANCERDVLGFDLHTGTDDPMMHGGDLDGVARHYAALTTDRDAFWSRKDVPNHVKLHVTHARTIHALKVARGAATVDELPADHRPKPVPPEPTSGEQLGDMLAQLPPGEREKALRRLAHDGVAVPPSGAPTADTPTSEPAS